MSKRTNKSSVDVIISSYTDCGCRDCMNLAITSNVKVPSLCNECQESGCEANNGECQSPSAYGCDE